MADVDSEAARQDRKVAAAQDTGFQIGQGISFSGVVIGYGRADLKSADEAKRLIIVRVGTATILVDPTTRLPV
jgi:hypothetical protein